MVYHVFEEGVISSTSDHLPLCMELCTDIKKHILCKPLTSLPAWHKAKPDKLREYEKFIFQNADSLCKTLNTVQDLASLCIEINNVLYSAASEFITTAKYKPYLRREWTHQVKSLHNTERRQRKLWISEGRSRGMEHETYKNYKRAKRNFRNELNIEYDRYICLTSSKT